MKFGYKLAFLLLFAITTFQCKDDETEETADSGSVLSISIKDKLSLKGIKASIFLNDSLYGSCDSIGNFKLETLDTGNYTLICSAMYFRDTAVSFSVNKSSHIKLNFELAIDSTMGRVYGEFEDMQLYQKSIIQKPEIDSWNEKMKFDAVTGATLFYKNFTDNLPPRLIIMSHDTLAFADGFGQYWFKIQSGTYQIEAICKGYKSVKSVITVAPNTKNYKNFYLERKQ